MSIDHTKASTPERAPILYADLTPNSAIGEYTDAFDQAMFNKWCLIFSNGGFGPEDAAPRASLTLALAMRALLSVVAPRPPGNIHARQKIVTHVLPGLGQTIHSKVTCLHKEIKRERFYVDFEVKGRDSSGGPMYDAQMTLIWAA